jgi:predicted nucleotidyltransferase
MTNLKAIRSFCNQVAREFRPQKIILFGSYAGGRPTEASDVDLLVIMPHRGSAVRKAVEIEMKVRMPEAQVNRQSRQCQAPPAAPVENSGETLF